MEMLATRKHHPTFSSSYPVPVLEYVKKKLIVAWLSFTSSHDLVLFVAWKQFMYEGLYLVVTIRKKRVNLSTKLSL